MKYMGVTKTNKSVEIYFHPESAVIIKQKNND